ncbi:PAS domain S-box protein [Patescibacteria group bacterium]|nr:PAS domain S-box protein [Patescibacteria group bacterium]
MSDSHSDLEIQYNNEIDKLSKLLVSRDLELTDANNKLDDKILELKKANIELSENKNILEIRLNARTRQLQEVIEGLDKQVTERTAKLAKSQKALMNILEDNQAEKRIAQKERDKTYSIISNFSDGLLIFDSENKLIIINKMAEKILNINKENFEGKNIEELVNNDKLKALINVLENSLEDVFRKEYKVDEENTLELTISSIKQNDETINKFLILHDITREKKVQSLKSEFVSIAAHQLRTPLSAIKWTLTALLDEDFGDLNDDQKKYIGKANLSNERMINLVDDLLNLSRIEEGKYVQAQTYLRIEDLVKEVLEGEEIKSGKKNIVLNFTKDKVISEVFIDKEKIKLVIQNLVENAINYGFESTKVDISLTENKKEHEVQLKITNMGIGISEESKERIFTKFFRAENAVRLETVGSGLGLFINKNIIESHGGKIWFESSKDGETSFYFRLPVKDKVSEFLSKL